MRFSQKFAAIACVTSVLLSALVASTQRAHALDRRLERPLLVMGKTTAVGTGAGLLGGAAALAFFGASGRTFGKITSLGLYGGVLFGLFILLAPPEAIYGERPLDGAPDVKAPSRFEQRPDDWGRRDRDQDVLQKGVQPPFFWAPVLNAQF